MRFLLLTLSLLVAVHSAGCSTRSCTLIGCIDQLSIAVRSADGARPGYSVDLLVDGREVVCPAPAPAGDGVVESVDCGEGVSVSQYELADCIEERRDDAVSQRCTPNGRFEQTITLWGTPAKVVVTLKDEGAIVASRTFESTYQVNRPNGPECEPECRQAAETWTLPRQ